MKCQRGTTAQFGLESCGNVNILMRRYLKRIESSKFIKDLIRPSLEWLSRHHWADPAAHPHLFPAQAPHPPAKYRTIDERDVNGDSCEKCE